MGEPAMTCTHVLRQQGKAYPRTCQRCGLGPCPFYNKDGNLRASGDEGASPRPTPAADVAELVERLKDRKGNRALLCAEAADRLAALSHRVGELTRENEALCHDVESAGSLRARLDVFRSGKHEAERRAEAAEAKLAEAVAALAFYADPESYRNRPLDEQRQLLNGADPTIRITGLASAPPGTALSDIEMDRHGNRARSIASTIPNKGDAAP